jgi:hypothetical protein
MSQQINLLPPPSHNVLVPASIGVLMVVVLATGLYLRSSLGELHRARQDAAEASNRAANLRAAVAGLQDPKRREAAARLDAEIAQMREQSAAAGEFLRQVDSGTLGRPAGYPGMFQALAASAQEDVWITRVAITRGGNAVLVTGSAMSNEAALQYAQRASERMRDAGVKFRTFDLKPGASTTGSTPIVTFTLS